MQGSRSKLDYEDTLVLKGMAILAIVLHNYFHLLDGAVKENQFEFEPARVHAFLRGVEEPTQVFQACLSFLGHYGVQVFIFLSAYGLAKRYWDTEPGWWEFLWSRVKKIYPGFLLAILLWVALIAGTNPSNAGHVLGAKAGALLLTVLGIENLVPGLGLPPVGPWWFVPFIMQFYCVWPALRWFGKRFGLPGLIGLSVASFLIVNLSNDASSTRWSLSLLETPVGHLPELCLGVAAARYGVLPRSAAGVAAMAVFAVGSSFRVLWPLTFPSVVVVVLWAYGTVRERARRWPALRFIGVCSMALFFVNGFTRFPFLALASVRGDWLSGVTLGLLSTGYAIAIAQLLTALEKRLRGEPIACARASETAV